MRRLAAVACLLFATLCAPAHGADERVKRIAIYVEPYYAASRDAEGTPRVEVASKYDRLLASNNAEDVARARDLIAQEYDSITPMTMMVLAIRLYDVGLRDDAVFWFYAAKNRFVTAARVVDMKARELGNAERATRDFIYLAGPVINGYAFLRHREAEDDREGRAQVDDRPPLHALLNPEIPALPGDRRDNFRKAFNELMAGLAKEEAYLDAMPNVESIKKQRRENGADVKYCWRN
jgi:hypothetical protein